MAKAKYTPIGEVLCAESAWVQAALALDVAAQMAVESRDTNGLIKVAETWNEIACEMKAAAGHHDDDEDEEDDDEEAPKPRLIGFQLMEKEEEDNGESSGED